jgi:hypothetical protein
MKRSGSDCLLGLMVGVALMAGGCSNARHNSTPNTDVRGRVAATQPGDWKRWIGVYSSPAETGGFSGTVLAVEQGFRSNDLGYEMTFYTDAHSADAIEEKVKHGNVLVQGDQLFLPEASGYKREGEISLGGYVTRYTRVRVNARTVLMRDDALREFAEHDRLYDYGILIKVSDVAEYAADLEKAKHESIKVLYKDPNKEWKDPFVNGANER